MSADPTTPIVAAARRRHELTRAKAIQALRELERAGAPVTFAAVAKAARISRSWLYTEPDLAADILRLREATADRPKTPGIPATQRASDASLCRRLELAEQRIRDLRRDNEQLRRQLAHALGDQRHTDRRATGPRATAKGAWQKSGRATRPASIRTVRAPRELSRGVPRQILAAIKPRSPRRERPTAPPGVLGPGTLSRTQRTSDTAKPARAPRTVPHARTDRP